MDDLDQLEEQLQQKEPERAKKKPKVSGRSVFKLQEIIKKKSAGRRKKDGDGASDKTLARDN